MVTIEREKAASSAGTTAAEPDAGFPPSAVATATEAVERGAAASGSAVTTGSELTPRLALELRAYRNARYHEDREGFFNALGRWSNFVGILLGSSAFAGGAAQLPALAMAGGALAAIVSAGRLVFDFGGKARTHLELRKSFLDILTSARNPNADVSALDEKMCSLYRGEPEVYNAVNVMAYNAAQRALGRAKDTIVPVTPSQALFRHFYRFEPSDFPDPTKS